MQELAIERDGYIAFEKKEKVKKAKREGKEEGKGEEEMGEVEALREKLEQVR